MHCSVQSPRTASECGARFLPYDKGSGARGQGEKSESAFGVWLTYSLFCSPQFEVTMAVGSSAGAAESYERKDAKAHKTHWR